MRREAVAVIDVGKTHVKLLAVAPDGTVLDTASAPSRCGNGALDVDAAWAWSRRELVRLARRFALTAIVPTTHGAAAAVVGEGRLLHPIVDYEAEPPADINMAYDAIRPPFAETFSPRLPGGLNLGRQFYWLQNVDPQAWRMAEAVLTYPQYWSWRLNGTAVSEVTSLGCHTDLWCPMQGRLSSVVASEGWSHLFPPLQPAWHSLGRVRPELDLAIDCEVLSGIHDSNAAYLRYLAGVPSPFVLLSTGTWMVCFNSDGDLRSLDPARDTLANVDVLGRPIACSRFMGGREYAAIAGTRGLALTPSLADVKTVLARRLFALPSFTATGGPHPQRRGRLRGEPGSAAEAAALATLYVALMSRNTILLTGPVTRLFIDGAFAANKAFAEVLAALLPDVEVHVALGTNGTAIGASLLARMASHEGHVPHLAVPSRKVVAPDVAIGPYADEWCKLVAESAGAA